MRKALALALFLAFEITAQEKTSDLPRLEGTVLDAVTGQPLKKATIMFQRMERGQLGPPSSYLVPTDEMGHFIIAGFETGDWVGVAERNGYVRSGQIGTDADPKPSRWRIEAETVIKDVVYRLTPTGVITGRVIDADGDPVVGAEVRLTAYRAKSQGAEFRSSQTNDIGEYRIYNITPGKYIVTAAYQSPWQQSDTRMVAGSRKSSSDKRYIATHYPSTGDPRQATPVTVGMGAQVAGVQIRLLRGGVVRLRGQLVNAGDIASAGVFVNLAEIQEGVSGNGAPAVTHVDPDGTFEFGGIRPGRYRLRAEAGMAGPERLHGSTIVEVGNTDIDGIQLTLGPAVKLSGRVIVEGDAHLPATRLEASLRPRGVDDEGEAYTIFRPDGSFAFETVYEGRYDLLLHFPRQESDLYVKAMRLANEDVLNEGIHVHGQPGDNLEIVLNNQGATLNCSLVSDKGEPIRRAQVILVPDEPSNHAFSLFRQAESGEDGSCKIRGLAPGAYRAFAFPPEPYVDIRRVDEWKPYDKFAKPVRFAPKETVQLQIQAIPAQSEEQ